MSLSCRAHYANTASNPVLLQCMDSVFPRNIYIIFTDSTLSI